MIIRTLIFVLLLGMSAQGSAGTYSAGKILAFCESDEFAEGEYCILYLTGIADAYYGLLGAGVMKQKIFCIPADITAGQLKTPFIKYASGRPEEMHLSASSLVLNAFIGAFPCE